MVKKQIKSYDNFMYYQCLNKVIIIPGNLEEKNLIKFIIFSRDIKMVFEEIYPRWILIDHWRMRSREDFHKRSSWNLILRNISKKDLDLGKEPRPRDFNTIFFSRYQSLGNFTPWESIIISKITVNYLKNYFLNYFKEC